MAKENQNATEDEDFGTTMYFDEDGEPLQKEAPPTKEPQQKKGEAPAKDDDDDDIDVEIVDDTPEEDRGRKPMPKEIVDELELEESKEEYSKSVRERMDQLRKVWHDERRAREAAERQNQEYTSVTQRMHQELQQLRKQLSSGETWALDQAKKRAELEVDRAKRLYAEAYEEGDSKKIADAQEAMGKAISEFDRVSQMRPIYNTLQDEPEPVYNQQQQRAPQQNAPKVDPRAQEWAQENEWFGKDDEMTSFALGVHKKLVEGGVAPDTDEYYERLDARMRQVFPDQFKSAKTDDDGEEEKPKKEQQSRTVVAPAARAPRSKNKVTLTKSQLAIAKKIGVSPEQYAKELLKLNEGN